MLLLSLLRAPAGLWTQISPQSWTCNYRTKLLFSFVQFDKYVLNTYYVNIMRVYSHEIHKDYECVYLCMHK